MGLSRKALGMLHALVKPTHLLLNPHCTSLPEPSALPTRPGADGLQQSTGILPQALAVWRS